jgi:hypothetical protein
MGRASEEQEVIAALERYVAGVTDPKNLNIRVAAAAIGRSHETLRKYGLNKRLRRAKAELKSTSSRRKRSGSASGLSQSVERYRDAARDWEQKYHNLLSRYVKLEYWCRVRHNIDVDGLVAEEIPRPNRQQPL